VLNVRLRCLLASVVFAGLLVLNITAATAGVYNFNIAGPELGPNATGINPFYVLQPGDSGTLTNYVVCLGVCSNPDPGNLFTSEPGGPGGPGSVTGYLPGNSEIQFTVTYTNPSFDPSNLFMTNEMFLGSQSASGTISTDLLGNIKIANQIGATVSVQSTDVIDQNGNPVLTTVLTAVNDTAMVGDRFEVFFQGTSDSGLINPTMTYVVSAVPVSAVPEPSAVMIFGGAVAGLAGVVRRRGQALDPALTT